MTEPGEGGKKKGSRISSTPTTRSAETAEEVKNLKRMVELLIDENKKLKQQITDENRELKEQIAESIKSTKFFSEMFEDYKKSNDEILKKLDEVTNQNKELIQKNQKLEKEIKNQMEERNKMEERFYSILIPIEMEKRCKNLELHGIDEKEDENCTALVKDVLEKITPKPLEVIESFRTGYKFTRSGERKQRPILIKFASKENSLTAYANRSNLKKIEHQTLYLNQNLPPYLRILRGKANTLKKEKSYKFLWIKDGTILLRKNEESKVIAIKTQMDLNKII